MLDLSYYAKIRLYVPDELSLKKIILLKPKQTHYLKNVMRKKNNDFLLIFNEVDGEFLAEIETSNKKIITAKVIKKIREPEKNTDIWVLFAPVKKTPTEYIIQKVTELGASKILPVFTERTITRSVNLKRMNEIAVEASEQCERITVPEILPMQKLTNVIDAWESKRKIYYADETMRNEKESRKYNDKLFRAFCGAILVGPEGGFSTQEIDYLRQKAFIMPMNFGYRILRSDTAIITAMVLWHSFNGDMRDCFKVK